MAPLNALAGAVTLRITLYVCAALLLLSIVLGGWLKVTMLQRDKARADNAGWSAMAKLQNQAVEQWQEKAEAQQLRAADAQSESVQIRNASRKEVAKIMSAQVPSKCPDAVQWGAIEAAKLAELWEENQ